MLNMVLLSKGVTLMYNCKICKSIDKKKIETDILLGKSGSYFKKTYEIGYSTLRRHKEDHLSKEIADDRKSRMVEFQLPKIMVEKEFPPLDNILDCLSFIHNESLGIYKKAKDEQALNVALQALRLDMDCIGLALRGDELRQSYQAQGSWEKIFPIILEVLKDYEDARVAVSNRLLEHEDASDFE
jgi:hypothetical protein